MRGAGTAGLASKYGQWCAISQARLTVCVLLVNPHAGKPLVVRLGVHQHGRHKAGLRIALAHRPLML